ncbi:hypothetical protein EM308_00215 [Flavobacterium gilvum]|uniref:Uncharacterized protein n=1 Tax=Flavobacterium gilvum TaxID=1492737 RepID=A0AAC9I1K0_9FLAO|nr:hypothetical protein EM308_00215 [Flavobacterium gilvum]
MNKAQLNSNFKKITSISILAKESEIYFEGESLTKLLIQLDKTKLYVPVKKRISILSGTLKNNSNCLLTIGNSVNLDADKTSVYQFYNN